MAVYKSTHCYPFINNIDVRNTLIKGTNEVTHKELTCKVNTSNKNVTGYSIRILDEDNNVIFPVSSSIKISPISELQDWEYEPGKTNSGVNGTFLKLPFFQNDSEKLLNSYNAVYYKVKHGVDHLIYTVDIATAGANYKFENPINWVLNGAGDGYEYNWSGDSSATDEDKKRDKIFLDGEVLIGGEIVLVANNSSSVSGIPSGYYEAVKTTRTEDNHIRVSTKLRKIANTKWNPVDASSEEYFSVILKGERFSNKSIKRTSGTFAFVDETEKMWKDVDGNNVSVNFTGTAMYKWEITLYQGNYTAVSDSAVSCDYSGVGAAAYDMVLSTGTILGSTKDRVQIAYDDAFTGGGWPSASPNPDCVLPSQKEGVLVLQGKYMDFGRNTNTKFSNVRAYVQNYDATMGHVYPISGSTDTELIKNNDYVQFYKNSNDPQNIIQDKIAYGFDSNINFHYYNSNNPASEITLSAFEALSINNRLYGIRRNDISALSGVVGAALQAGDQILLIGQNDSTSFQNGVYEIYGRDDLNFSYSDLLLLKRFSPYNTWGGYIGKIFFVENFVTNHSVVNRNIESMAGANPDASLWNPSVVSGIGHVSLLLNEESPILLFEEKIGNDKYFDAVNVSSTNILGPSSAWDADTFFDGVQAFAGMKILTRYRNNPLSPSEQPELRTCTLNADNTYSFSEWTSYVGQYAYARQGKTLGQRVLYVNGSVLLPSSDFTVTWRLHSAKILKNTTDFTYISPFADLQENMSIKFIGNNFVMLDDAYDTMTQWLTIHRVNSQVYCVLHNRLTDTLVSEVSTANNTPWKYEVRSFFKTSDSNPFYCYESPYLVLYKNNMEYGGILTSLDEEAFSFGGNSISFEGQDIALLYRDLGQNYSKPLKLSAMYVQKDGLSWESCQWVLLDSNGNVLKDSGKRYDRELSMVFDGLTQDRDSYEYSSYYIILSVEDSLKNTLSYGIQVFVYKGGIVPGNFPFEASYDCGLHAIKLSYSGLLKVGVSYRDDSENVEKVYKPNSDIWDGGVSYEDNIGLEITHKDREQKAIVDYSRGATTTGTDAIPVADNFSHATSVGVPYYRSFGSDDNIQEIDGTASLSIPEPVDGVSANEFYFETEVILNKNHCGSVFDLYIQGDGNGALVEDLYETIDGEMSPLNGYIVLSLNTERNFVDEEHPTSSLSNLYSDRNRFKLKIEVNPVVPGTPIVKDILLSKIKTFELGTSLEYYLQPMTRTFTPQQLSTTEFLNYENNLYIQRDKLGEYFQVTDFFLGNLGLQNSSNGQREALLYWVEDRPYLSDNSLTINRVVDGYDYRTSDSHLLKWPSESGDYVETDFYWNEFFYAQVGSTTYGLTSRLPVFWKDFNTTDFWMQGSTRNLFAEQMVAIDKHYDLDKKKYHIVCKVEDVDTLYSGTQASSYIFTEDPNTQEGVSRVTIKVNNFEVGEILIEQEAIEDES